MIAGTFPSPTASLHRSLTRRSSPNSCALVLRDQDLTKQLVSCPAQGCCFQSGLLSVEARPRHVKEGRQVDLVHGPPWLNHRDGDAAAFRGVWREERFAYELGAHHDEWLSMPSLRPAIKPHPIIHTVLRSNNSTCMRCWPLQTRAHVADRFRGEYCVVTLPSPRHAHSRVF